MLVTWNFTVTMIATVIQKEMWKSPKLYTLEESETKAYHLTELG